MSAATAKVVAAELCISYDLFIRTRTELERRGFPKPLPLVSVSKRGRPPLRWSLDAVRDWIRNPTPARPATPAARTRDERILEARLG